MSMNIYTSGSGEFLQLILNASAMITGSGFTEDLVRIGMLIGMLLLGFQAVWNGQGISFQKASVLFVVYLLFYGPTTTAVIEDTTTNQVRVVDNLPMGPTFIGSVVSTVAHNITKTAEQAFSTPTMTDYGLFSSLNTLSRVRDVLRNPLGLDSFANYRKNSGWDLPKSVNEYLTYCTLNPINLRNNTSVDEIYRSAGLESVFNAPLTSQSAYIYDGAVGGRLDSCTNIRPRLTAAVREAMVDVMGDILDKGFAVEKEAGKITTQFDLQNRIDQSIQSFAISAKNAQSYTEMSLIHQMFGDARVNALNHWQEQNAALALRESLNHQEVQWAGKGDTFKHYMRPMIAVFEGLLYAMSPFVAFALVLGDKGVSILGKYMVLPLAIALWMPLLSFVNAFTLWYAGAEMQAIFDSYDPTSQSFAMLQLLDMDHAISKAFGIGGLLAASVPPLALFIVSGSAMVANSIMSQMTQGDKFRSEDVTPRAKDQAPVMTTTASYTSDQISTGVSVTGARQAGPKISASDGAQAQVRSDEQYAQATTQQLKESIATASSQLAQTSEGRQVLAGLGSDMSSTLTGSNAAGYQQASNFLQGKGFSKQEIDASAFSFGGGFSIPYGLGGANLKQDQRYQNMSSDEQKQVEQAVATLQQTMQSANSSGEVFRTADNFINASQAVSQTGITEGVEESLTKARTAQDAFVNSSARSQEWSMKQDLDMAQAARNSVLHSGQVKGDAARGIADLAGKSADDRAAIKSLAMSETVKQMSSDMDERMIIASTMHMMQSGRLDELMGSRYDPFNFDVDGGDAYKNAALKTGAPNADGLEGRVGAEIQSGRGAYYEMEDHNRSGHSATLDNGKLVIAGADERNSVRVAEFNSANNDKIKADLESNPMPEVDIKLQNTNPVEETAVNYGTTPMTAVSDGAEQLATGAATVLGVEDNKYVQAGIRFATSPFDTALTGAQQISDAISGMVEGKKKPPSIE